MQKNGKKKSIIILALILVALCALGLCLFLLGGDKSAEKKVEDIYNGTGDISWYDSKEKEFTITTKEQLYGFADLSKKVDFNGKTVKLGADIVVNEGDSEDWAEKAPADVWSPIVNFAGKFDGQGHTISGLYANVSDEMLGFFVDSQPSCIIENFKLVNTYFAVYGDQAFGAISASGGGTIRKVYTDAILMKDGWHCGGIFGAMQLGVTLEECWFDGSIEITGRFGGGMTAALIKGNGVINHCLNTGTIVCTFPGPQASTVGGLCGLSQGRMIISDSLSTGLVVSTEKRPETGSLVGAVVSTMTADKLWATYESNDSAIAAVYADRGGKVTGAARQLLEDNMLGVAAYQRTDLDFENYWAVVEEGTPILKCFADDVPSLEGVKKGLVADTTWYDPSKVELEIKTAEELYGFSLLAAGGVNFYGKIIRLANNISYNDGKATEWNKEVPLNIWFPIEGFHGNFDGQGHTISGLYTKSVNNVGMFGSTKSKSSIKNLKLVNSYFECEETLGNKGSGGISGTGGGTFENLYVDVIIKAKGHFAGGIIGALNENSSISNCWFAGTITMEERFGGGIIGCAMNYNKYGVQSKTSVTVEHCLNSGSVFRETKQTNSATIGGIIGLLNCTAKVNDCLNVGKISSTKNEKGQYDEIGSIIACIGADANCTVDNSWATKESCPRTITTIKEEGKSTVNICQYLDEVYLTGYNSVQSTSLDFKNYWAVDLKSTPVLKKFASKIPSIAGIVQPDMSWYKANTSTYIIDTVNELYGLSVLSAGTDFAGKTIKLAANLNVNSGNAADWTKNVPKNVWTPIQNFAGTFDGQGHSISGLYSKQTGHAGLFAIVKPACTIKNLNLKNSYFETTVENVSTGSIVAEGGGNFANIYSDAIVKSSGTLAGGLFGVFNENANVSNCWFDGAVELEGRYGGGILGAAIKYMKAGANRETTVIIAHCLNTGSVIRTKLAADSATIGGICGLVNNKATITDCLNVGTVSSKKQESGKYDEIGSIVACVGATANCTIDDVWASQESCVRTITTIKEEAKSNIDICQSLSLNNLQGFGGYQLTSLDFDKYWSVVVDDTPVLKTYATSSPSLAGYIRPDYSWYNESQNSYTIKTAAQLYGLAILSSGNDFEGKTIKLGANITVNNGNAVDYTTTKPKNAWTPILGFAGTFDGQGYTISGLYGTASESDIVGMSLFTKTAVSAKIKNFKLTNSYFETSGVYGLSAIAARGNGHFEAIYSDAILVNKGGNNTGGIVGIALIGELLVENCWFNGSIVDGAQRIGGIVGNGNGQKVTIQHCLNSGTIQRQGSNVNAKWGFVGGIIGGTGGTTKVIDCLNVGTVTSERTGDFIGSLIGQTDGASSIINNSYATTASCAKVVGVNSNGADLSNAKTFVRDNLVGLNGYYNSNLDFTTYWSVVKDDTPVLTSFADANQVVDLSNIIKPNMGWYDDNKQEFVIYTVEELYGFARLTINGKTFQGKTVKLGADITVNGDQASSWNQNPPTYTWYPITRFAGTFDGQGYTISGLYASITSDPENVGIGLFGRTTAGTQIQNLEIANSYFANKCSMGLGTIVSRGSATIKNVYVHADVSLVNDIAGGNENGNSGGIIGLADAGKVTIENCWFAGTLIANSKNSGGILGNANNMEASIAHCLNTGTITRKGGKFDNSGVGGICGFTGGKITIIDCLNIGTATDADGKNGQVGSVIGACNGSANGTISSTYAATESSARTIGLNNSGGKVTDASSKVAMTGLKGVEAYNNTGLDFIGYWVVIKDKTPELKIFANANEILDVSGQIKIETNWYKSELNEFEINSIGQLYGLAKLASEGNTFAGKKIKLTSDITVNNGTASEWATKAPQNVWTPIKNFAGTFDGQGKTIRGLYGVLTSDTGNFGMGLFGRTASTSQILNLVVENTYFANKCSMGLSAVVSRGAGTFKNIHVKSDVILVNDIAGGNDNGNSGGIIGLADAGKVTIENCWFAGNLTANSKNSGGILGNANNMEASIVHCLNTGTITRKGGKYDNSGVAGICGFTGGEITISDCLNTGIATDADGKNGQVGAIIGACNGSANGTITNSYAVVGTSARNIGLNNSGGKVTDSSIQIAKDRLLGVEAYYATELDFANYWVTRNNDVPALKSFVATSDVLPLTSAITPDTSWFNTTTNSGTITTIADLYGFASLSRVAGKFTAASSIKLGNDVVLNKGLSTSWATTAPTNVWAPIVNFPGTFDGQEYTISGLYGVITADANNYGMGLFGRTVSTSKIQNLSVENSYLANKVSMGLSAVVSRGSCSIKNIYVHSDVILINDIAGGNSNGNTGGIIGLADAGKVTVENCWFAGTITANSKNSGGILGNTNNMEASISHCLNTGTVTRKGGRWDNAGVGGICGFIGGKMTMTDCLNVGMATDANGMMDQVGSIVGACNGTANGTITNTWATNESSPDRIGLNNSGGNISDGSFGIALNNLKGDLAKTNTTLDFTNYWNTVTDGIPVLKHFVK